eukprot:s346_g5.t1
MPHDLALDQLAVPRQLTHVAFDKVAVTQSIFGMPSMANGLTVRDLLREVGISLADADVKAHRVMGLTDSQRVRMFTEKALDNIQHARELHSQVEDSVANVGIGVPREEEDPVPSCIALGLQMIRSRRAA